MNKIDSHCFASVSFFLPVNKLMTMGKKNSIWWDRTREACVRKKENEGFYDDCLLINDYHYKHISWQKETILLSPLFRYIYKNQQNKN